MRNGAHVDPHKNMNISSLVVDARPDRLDSVTAALQALPGVTVHASAASGKLVVCLETDTDFQATDTVGRIGALDGVMSVALVFHQFEPDPDLEIRHGTDTA